MKRVGMNKWPMKAYVVHYLSKWKPWNFQWRIRLLEVMSAFMILFCQEQQWWYVINKSLSHVPSSIFLKIGTAFLPWSFHRFSPFSGKIHDGMIPTGINPKACWCLQLYFSHILNSNIILKYPCWQAKLAHM